MSNQYANYYKPDQGQDHQMWQQFAQSENFNDLPPQIRQNIQIVVQRRVSQRVAAQMDDLRDELNDKLQSNGKQPIAGAHINPMQHHGYPGGQLGYGGYGHPGQGMHPYGAYHPGQHAYNGSQQYGNYRPKSPQPKMAKPMVQTQKDVNNRIDALFASYPTNNQYRSKVPQYTTNYTKSQQSWHNQPPVTVAGIQHVARDFQVPENLENLSWVENMNVGYGGRYTGTAKKIGPKKFRRHGYGRYVSEEGQIVEGQYRDGQSYGFSRQIYTDELIMTAIWDQKGEMVQQLDYNGNGQ